MTRRIQQTHSRRTHDAKSPHPPQLPRIPVRPLLLAALLVLMVVVAYWPTLSNGYIWDDDYYVHENPTLRSVAGLRDIWFKLGAVPQYYPLVHTTYWIEYQLWGVNPRGYHAVNLLLHAVSAILLWRLLTRLAVPGAFLAASIFAVHPVAVESVAWITERKNVLSCALALGSLLAYLRFLNVGSAGKSQHEPTNRPLDWKAYTLAFALYVGALWAKTVTASLPAVILVITWWRQGRITRKDVRPLVPFFCVGLLLAGITVWMEKVHVGADGEDWNFSLADRILIAGRALWFYAGKLVWPWPLVFFYPRWTIDSSSFWQYLYPATAAMLIACLWAVRNRIGRGPLAAVLIFSGVLVPALGFFDVYPFVYSFVADHFQYHASIGLITLLAACLAVLARRVALPAALSIVGAVLLLLALGSVTRERTLAYRDLATLYTDTIAQNPQAWMAHQSLGVLLQEQGRIEQATAHYEAAARIVPPKDWPRRVGSSLYMTSRLDEAAKQLRAALAQPQSDRWRGQTHLDLGKVLVKQQHFDDAVGHFQQSSRLRPDDPRPLLNLAEVQRHQENWPAAAKGYQACLAINPGEPVAVVGLAEALIKLDRQPEASTLLVRAIRQYPQNVELRKSYATALYSVQQWRATEAQLRAAVAIRDDDVQVRNLLGIVLGNQGDFDAALQQFEAALAIDPANSSAAANLQRARIERDARNKSKQ